MSSGYHGRVTDEKNTPLNGADGDRGRHRIEDYDYFDSIDADGPDASPTGMMPKVGDDGRARPHYDEELDLPDEGAHGPGGHSAAARAAAYEDGLDDAADGDGDDYDDGDDDLYAAPAGATAVERDEDGKSGLPVRGLAMVLIFLGVIALGWGIWTLVQGAGEGDGAEPTAAAPAETAVEAGRAPAPVDPNAVVDPNAPANPTGPAGPNAPVQPGQPGQPDRPGQAAPAGDPRASVQIHVRNNGTVQGQAEDTATMLRGDRWNVVDAANLPTDQGIVTTTTIFYTPGNATEQAAAEEIALANGWDVAARDARVDGQPGGIIVVTTG